MDLMRKPELADRLAAAYALGTLRGGARRRFEAIARHSPMVRALAFTWQERFAAMTELQPEHAPSPNVWKRIRIELDAQRGANQLPAAGVQVLSRSWRAFALAGAVGSVAAAAMALSLFVQLGQRADSLAHVQQQNVQLVSQLRASPDIRYVAMLSDERSTPTMLVTFDPKHNTLTLKRLDDFKEGAQKSLQLWALPSGGSPKSLGVLAPTAVVKLTAAENEVKVPALAISLEPKGGVSGERGPTGPVLFKGAVVPTS
jgi:anti-sigma-K factor RskA